MSILVVNNSANSKDNLYTSKICEILGTKRVVHYKNMDIKKANSYDGVVLSGSSVNGNLTCEERLPFYGWLLDFDKPILGICAGHHILGLINNSRYIKEKQAVIGKRKIFLTDTGDRILEGVRKGEFVYEEHKYTVSLPDNFLILAYSIDETVEIMKHKEKNHYGVQFHPEKSLGLILTNFKKIVTDNKYQT